MQNLLQEFSPSDYVSIFGIIASLTTSIIAIAISIKTLKQNSKMIEETTRPQIQIYPIYLDTLMYIVIKNFGSSEAYIDELSCDHIFSSDEVISPEFSGNPFSKVNGSILVAGHSLKCPFIGHKFPSETLNFHIKYHSTSKSYEHNFSFNPLSSVPYPHMYPSSQTTDEHLRQIAKELHNISNSDL